MSPLKAFLPALLPALLSLGCTVNVTMPEIPETHPANPDAVVSPLPPPSPLLSSYRPLEPPPAPGSTDQPATDPDGRRHEEMDHGDMDHDPMDHGESHPPGEPDARPPTADPHSDHGASDEPDLRS